MSCTSCTGLNVANVRDATDAFLKLQLINLRDFRHASFTEVTAIHSEQYVNALEEVGAACCTWSQC